MKIKLKKSLISMIAVLCFLAQTALSTCTVFAQSRANVTITYNGTAN